jgi:CHAD domain-containing protein
MLSISRWLATPDEEAAAGPQALRAFALRAVRDRHERVVSQARHIARLDATARHRLRIEVKRLRYAADALGALFEPARARRYREALADLQDALGEANDAATARHLVKALDAPRAFIRFARERFEIGARGEPDEWVRLARRVEAVGPPPLAPAARRLRRA